MPRTVDLAGVRELLGRGAQLVEVLPREEYEELHLPGAISIPLKTLDAESAAELDAALPVVVYCWDALCDMSPRAAAMLETLGFDAYDYALSKVDWMAHGLPMEGTGADPTAGSLARSDVETCAPGERAAPIAARIAASPYGFALVLADGVVLGRLRGSRLDGAAPDASAGELMEPGPSTIRPHTPAGELRERLEREGRHTAVITTPAGELLGVARVEDLPPAPAT